jgi:hypothetical protein
MAKRTIQTPKQMQRMHDMLHAVDARCLGSYQGEPNYQNKADLIERWLVGKTIIYVHFLDDSCFCGQEVAGIGTWIATEQWINNLNASAHVTPPDRGEADHHNAQFRQSNMRHDSRTLNDRIDDHG